MVGFRNLARSKARRALGESSYIQRLIEPCDARRDEFRRFPLSLRHAMNVIKHFFAFFHRELVEFRRQI
jgi:hypothetical protein